MRKVLSNGNVAEATDQMLAMMMKTANNAEFFRRLKEWLRIWEKDGYSLAEAPAAQYLKYGRSL
jgi:hypothetical protein